MRPGELVFPVTSEVMCEEPRTVDWFYRDGVTTWWCFGKSQEAHARVELEGRKNQDNSAEWQQERRRAETFLKPKTNKQMRVGLGPWWGLWTLC